MRSWLAVLPLLVLAGIVWYMALSLGSQEDFLSAPALRSRSTVSAVPQFDLEPLAGFERGLATSDLRGRGQVVNFFASWCTPCLAEHPLLMRLAQSWPQSIHGINFRDQADQAFAWLERHGNPYWRIGYDSDLQVAIEWGVIGVPETFVIDSQGRIRHRIFGPLTEQTIEQLVLPLLEEHQ